MIFCEVDEPRHAEFARKNYGLISNRLINSGFSRDNALIDCRNYDNIPEKASCFYLIKSNGFRIPKDYPHNI